MKVKTLFLTLLFIAFFLVLPALAQGGISDNPCIPGEVVENCDPPTLQQGEFLFVKVIYFVWGFGLLIWLAYFINIARLYFTDDPNKIADAKKRFAYWIVGIAMFYMSITVVTTVMQFVISDDVAGTSGCYEQFRQTPGFTFFFPDVCT